MAEIAEEFDDELYDGLSSDLLEDLVLRKPVRIDAKSEIPKRKLSVRELKINKAVLSQAYATYERKTYIQNLWKKAFQAVKHSGDPWNSIDFSQLPVEKARRYRYNALKDKWIEDIVELRMQLQSFGRGAMRECFRVKKLSSMVTHKDWSHADNYVAKRYLEAVDRKVYFDDVKLQMDAKLWGEEYSRQSAVSRKVDIIQISILEMFDRPGKPIYHLEHFIEGSYRKYNSNSGFVDSHLRNTPQAFSHFTFEQSGHKLIVVDIQGVGDLWTDPQIHTVRQGVYGDGNLGIRGMALFFHTHRCNQICKAFNLAPFDLHPSELVDLSTPEQQKLSQQFFGATKAISTEVRARRVRHGSSLYSRLLSNSGSDNDLHPPSMANSPSSPPPPALRSKRLESGYEPDLSPTSPKQPQSVDEAVKAVPPRRRKHLQSECWPDSPLTADEVMTKQDASLMESIIEANNLAGSCDSNLFTNRARKLLEDALLEFRRKITVDHKSSCVLGLQGLQAYFLGEIHHELARLHESGRFARMAAALLNCNDDKCGMDSIADKIVRGEELFDNHRRSSEVAKEVMTTAVTINWQAVIFHEECAAQLECQDAVVAMAHYYLGLDVDGPLADCPVKSSLPRKEAFFKGYQLMVTAANNGDKSAMLFVADTNYLGSPDNEFKPDWKVAQHWYNQTIEFQKAPKRSDSNETDDDEDHGISMNFNALDEWPLHKIYARLAELHTRGGNGLDKNHTKAYELYECAADAANEALDGHNAMKYYDLMERLEIED